MKKEQDLKNRTKDELQTLSEAKRAELVRLKFKKMMGQLEKTADLGKLRKEIARIETFKRQKELENGARR